MTRRDEHTPEPWHIETELDGRMAVYRKGSVGHAICCFDYSGGGPGDPDPMPNASANARLIAAAPALLKAAERVVAAHSDEPRWSEPGDSIAALRSAIAQARKETR